MRRGVFGLGSGSESLRVPGSGLIEGGLASLDDLGVPTGVQIRGAQVGDARVVVRVVVPVEEVAAPGARGVDALEPRRVVRAVLERFELGFRVGIGVHRQLRLFATLKRVRCG